MSRTETGAGRVVPGRRVGAGQLWALVLAGGDGTRLAGLTVSEQGAAIPKQYCSLTGPRSLLRLALDRAEALVSPERLLAVVADQHRCWWQPELAGLPDDNIVVQPANRGTAAGTLLPLLRIDRRDPHAVVVLLPSDHFVTEEWTLVTALTRAVAIARAHPARMVLIGLTPQSPDPDYGWILPGRMRKDGAARVRSFVEKPNAPAAARLMAQGALISSFLIVAPVRALLGAIAEQLPALVAAFRSATRSGSSRTERLVSLYETLPTRDLSRHVLQPAPQRLWVLSVPPCGWSDLGTPERVASCLRGMVQLGRAITPRREPRAAAPLELVARLAGADTQRGGRREKGPRASTRRAGGSGAAAGWLVP